MRPALEAAPRSSSKWAANHIHECRLVWREQTMDHASDSPNLGPQATMMKSTLHTFDEIQITTSETENSRITLYTVGIRRRWKERQHQIKEREGELMTKRGTGQYTNTVILPVDLIFPCFYSEYFFASFQFVSPTLFLLQLVGYG